MATLKKRIGSYNRDIWQGCGLMGQCWTTLHLNPPNSSDSDLLPTSPGPVTRNNESIVWSSRITNTQLYVYRDTCFIFLTPGHMKETEDSATVHSKDDSNHRAIQESHHRLIFCILMTASVLMKISLPIFWQVLKMLRSWHVETRQNIPCLVIQHCNAARNS